MKILVVNCGSSSLKYQFVDTNRSEALAIGVVERIGDARSRLTHRAYPESCHEYKRVWDQHIPDHATAMREAVDLITDPEFGVADRDGGIEGIGHRVVHGGETFSAPALVTPEVLDAIRATVPLAPLHNPAALTGIETAGELFPELPQVAVFDTAFHQTLPPEAYLYGVPRSWYDDLGVRRYGFHGTSHACVVRRAARRLGRPVAECNFITLHLGNGSSICAVRGGECIDTSMGMTPLAGVPMGTRCGDLDPAVPLFVARQTGMSLDEVEDVLTRESGLAGMGGAADLRDLHSMAARGDERALTALRVLAYRARAYVGAYFVALGRVDALVFTAGIGENDPIMRSMICDNLQCMGVHLDHTANESEERGRDVDVATEDSPVRVLVTPTNEELEIARQTAEVLGERS